MLRAGQLRPWAWAQPAYIPVSVSTQSWESCPPAPAWTVTIAPRLSSRPPDCWARSHRSRSRARACASRRVSARASSSPSSRARVSSSSSSPIRRSNSRHSPRTLAFSPASLSMRTAASGFFQKSGPVCFRLSSASSRSICSGLKPRGCPGCQVPGLCGGRSPAVSFLCVSIHFSSPLRASWAFRRVQCGVEAARVEPFRLRPGTPDPAASWPPPGPGR